MVWLLCGFSAGKEGGRLVYGGTSPPSPGAQVAIEQQPVERNIQTPAAVNYLMLRKYYAGGEETSLLLC